MCLMSISTRGQDKTVCSYHTHVVLGAHVWYLPTRTLLYKHAHTCACTHNNAYNAAIYVCAFLPALCSKSKHETACWYVRHVRDQQISPQSSMDDAMQRKMVQLPRLVAKCTRQNNRFTVKFNESMINIPGPRRKKISCLSRIITGGLISTKGVSSGLNTDSSISRR